MLNIDRQLPMLSAAFSWVARPWGHALACQPLAAVAPHGWTTRELALEGDDARCEVAWTALAMGEHVERDHVIRLRQVHGATVVTAGEGRAAADALVSSDSRRLLAVKVADCVPLLIADRRTGAVAAVHAGWRGTAARIAQVVVRRMQEECDSVPGELVAAIGPSIRACCYEVGPELREAFRAAGASDDELSDWFTPGQGDRLQLDVPRSNADQLVAAGVPPNQVHDSSLCTACHPAWFYSYRRDKESTGRLVGYIRAGTGQPRQDT